MKACLFKTLWGHEGALASAIEQALDAGFEGIEGPAPLDAGERRSFFQELGATPWIAEVSTCTNEGLYVPEPGRSVSEHLASLEEGILRSLEGGPLFVNIMAGSDAWSRDDSMRFHEGVLQLEQKHGVALSVETHRGRPTYNPWAVRDILLELPELKITCDFSHWCVVSERWILDEEPGILALVASHAFHVQPRVGYAQGPQVPDPRAPAYAEALEAHERWWDTVWESMVSRGFERITMTPEFGPDGYLQSHPFTGHPVADLWELNQWIGRRQRSRFEKQYCQTQPIGIS